MIENLSAWNLFLPLIAPAVITLFTRRNPAVSAYISIAGIAASFLLTLGLYFRLGDQTALTVAPIEWLAVGNLKVESGFLVDRLSVLMLKATVLTAMNPTRIKKITSLPRNV